MTDTGRSVSVLWMAVVSALAVAACEPETAVVDLEAFGSIQVALTSVPPDVRCLRITIAGSNTAKPAERMVDLDPGASGLLTISGIPTGPVSISQQAYATACRSVTDQSIATWIGEATPAFIPPGGTAQVSLVLHPAGRARLDETFEPTTLTISPGSADFGSVTIGSSSSAAVFTVKNNGRTTSGALAITIAGRDLADFAIGANSCTSLSAGQTCTVGVSLRPLAPGPKSAALLVTGSPGGVTGASLTGVGLTAAILRIAPLAHDFGLVDQGTTVGPFYFTVTNEGQSPAVGPTATLDPTSSGGLAFDVVNNGCHVAMIAAGATCSVGVRATASTLLGSGFVQTATLTINAPGAVGTQPVALSLTTH